MDSGDDDSFLREVAFVPERAPEEIPARVAHFRIVGRLGRGGMGVVYRAHDETLRREIALKLLPEDDESAERRRRFIREARAAAKIRHPNVAAVHQIGEADGRVYIAMELIEGESLREKLENGAIAESEAGDIATQIARGLSAAHEQGIVHRDLKPENVMITTTGVVKLLDFGLAKSTPERAATTAETLVTADGERVLGTPAYMSPEQATGEKVDARSDVFSFGIVLFEMLCGERPFAGSNAGAVLVAIARDPAPPLHDVDARLEMVVARCLAKSPADRFKDAAEIVDALLAEDVAIARAPTRRSRTALFGIALGAIGVVAASAWPSDTPHAIAPAASSSAVVAPVVTRIIDLPLPKSDVPEALTEYKAGVQAIYDNTWFIATGHLMKALALDPSLAAAHLRLAMLCVTTRDPDLRRAEFEKAAGLRSQLSERDQAFMQAMQPWLQSSVQDPVETDKRLRALEERYPNDTEILMWLAAMHYFTPQALPIAERALALDPHDPYQWEVKGDALVELGKFDDAHDAYEQCAAFSIDGAECFSIMGWGDRAAGRCTDYERDMRRASDRSPMWLNLAVNSVATKGATPQLIEEMITQAVKALPPLFGPNAQRFAFQARLAFLMGDFVRAETLGRKALTLLSADPMVQSLYWLQLQDTSLLIDVALETGDPAAVQRLARDFVTRSQAWAVEYFLGQSVDVYVAIARLAYPTNAPPPPELEAARRAWIHSRLTAGAYKGQVWNYAYAIPAATPDEANKALDALAELGPPSPSPSIGGINFSGREGSPEAALGHVYLLAGRTDDAIPHLERGASACDLFDSTIDHVRASLDLGRALEQKGEHDRACDAYRNVLRVWGNATPRSVTADAARARATVLACGK